MVTAILRTVGLREWQFHASSLGAVGLCIGLWIRAKPVDQEERRNAERRARLRRLVARCPLADGRLARRARVGAGSRRAGVECISLGRPATAHWISLSKCDRLRVVEFGGLRRTREPLWPERSIPGHRARSERRLFHPYNGRVDRDILLSPRSVPEQTSIRLRGPKASLSGGFRRSPTDRTSLSPAARGSSHWAVRRPLARRSV